MPNFDAATVLASRRSALAAAVRIRYPTLCPGRVEDAVGDILLRACSHPGRYADVLARDGEEGLMRYAATAVRRAAKDQVRRRSYRSEVPAERHEPCQVATQEAVIAARDLDACIHTCAAWVNASHAEPIRAALWEKVLDGAPDTELAERHGVRREYVNRAWHRLLAAVAA